MFNRKITTWEICMIGVMVAATCILAQVSIPMPLGVPMTMQTFAICLCGLLLGPRYGALAALVYVLLGLVGLPVFAGFSGGFQKVFGPTGGFLLSFPLMAWLAGLGAERMHRKGAVVFWLTAANAANLLTGMLMFAAMMHTTLQQAFAACVLPFLPVTVVKTAAAGLLGGKLRKRLAFLP